MKNENIYNIPNFLTLLRVIITFFVVYFIFNNYDIIYIVVAFVLGMITDFLDGQIARRFNSVTEFGRKFDIIADRILMIATVLAIIIKFGSDGILNGWYIFQIIIILSREIISLPSIVMNILSKKIIIPNVRFIGKLTTFMQAIAFPLVLLNVFYYPRINFSIYSSIVTSLIGIISGWTYIKDLRNKSL